MKSGRLSMILWIALLLLFLNSANPILAQNDPPAIPETPAIQADITPVIGYQGRLVIDGVPVTGTHTLIFRIYSAQTGGSPEWMETKSIDIVNGLFHTALGDTEPFEAYYSMVSDDMWLEIEVNDTALPRQHLMGAPYALTLAPGAFMDGELPYSMFYVQNRGSGDAIVAASNSGTGLLAFSGSNIGLSAQSGGTGLAGPALKAESSSGTGIAVVSKNNSTDASLVIENLGTGPILKGFGDDAVDGDHEFIILNDGTVKQEATASGLVKAGALVYCSKTDPLVYRYFNNAGSSVTILPGSNTGECIIDFGFNMNFRFWMVDAVFEYPPFQHCKLDPGNFNRLLCTIRDYAGNPYGGGTITILVY